MKNDSKFDTNLAGLQYKDLNTADKSVVEKVVREGYSRREVLRIAMAVDVTTENSGTVNLLFGDDG